MFRQFREGTETFGGEERPVIYDELVYFRQFFDQLSGGVQYPFSQTRRLEFNTGLQRYSTDIEADQIVYDLETETAIDQRQGVNLPSRPRSRWPGIGSYVGTTRLRFKSRSRRALPLRGRADFRDLTYQTALADYRDTTFAADVAVRGCTTDKGRQTPRNTRN